MKNEYAIGATELRKNLDSVFDKVIKGQSIVIYHRFKDPIRLEPMKKIGFEQQKKLIGLKAFDTSSKKSLGLNKDKPLNQLYDASLSKKYAR